LTRLAWLDPRHVVVLLDADPDLAIGLPAEEFQAARGPALAHAIELEPLNWDTSEIRAQAEGGWLGLFGLDGLLIRRELRRGKSRRRADSGSRTRPLCQLIFGVNA
jgi:hypothetical protein